MCVCVTERVCVASEPEDARITHTHSFIYNKKNENHCTSVILSNKNFKTESHILAPVSGERCASVWHASLLHAIKWVNLIPDNMEACLKAKCTAVRAMMTCRARCDKVVSYQWKMCSTCKLKHKLGCRSSTLGTPGLQLYVIRHINVWAVSISRPLHYMNSIHT